MGTFVTNAASVLMVSMVTNVTRGTFITNATDVIPIVTNVTLGFFVTNATDVERTTTCFGLQSHHQVEVRLLRISGKDVGFVGRMKHVLSVDFGL
jgi:hypothetical protein